ncbi:MAG: glycoside hydrolase family 5 protein [Allosphingosinicella sp.]
MPHIRSLIASILCLLLIGCAAQTGPLASGAPAAAQQFRRGVNIIGYDPIWSDPAKARFQEKHFAEIRRGGFDFVRVNLFAFRHMDDANRLDPEWLERLDWVVREATEAGLGVILDQHDFDACAKDLPACRVKLPAFWRQVAPRYRDAPASVAFELLNEPYGPLDAATWNAFFPELLAIVRETNPTRTVVVGPTRWNNFGELPSLKLPEEDRNLLVTFHYYEPFRFTHQGASWAGDMKDVSGVTWSEADRAQIQKDFDSVAAWARANDRPILLGEFGAYDKLPPVEMRAAYADAVAREAEARGFGWSYWQFDSNFLAWDMAKDDWVEPIHRALIPEAGAR